MHRILCEQLVTRTHTTRVGSSGNDLKISQTPTTIHSVSPRFQDSRLETHRTILSLPSFGNQTKKIIRKRMPHGLLALGLT